MKLVLGARGRLGKALCRACDADALVTPERDTYARWWESASTGAIGAFLAAERIDTVLVAAGITDPAADVRAHERVNFELPRQVLAASAPLGIRVLTFGSIMEVLGTADAASPYVRSKRRLAACVQAHADAGARVLHLRIHTLYGGGRPSPFMFTGQMLEALRRRAPFQMSPGTQLREYHHVDDDAAAIVSLAFTAARGTLDLNHGDALPLADLARSVFDALDASSLLRIGALPAPSYERTDLRFARTAGLDAHAFRDASLAVPEDLTQYLGVKE